MAASTYPNAYDPASFLQVINNVTSLDSVYFDKINSCITQIEQTLGLIPQGIYTTVRARLDALEVGISTGAIGGSPHSLTLVTKFRLDFVSPVIPVPAGTATLSSVVGQVALTPSQEGGWEIDGYGSVYWCNRVYVDSGVTAMTYSLWDVTSTPTQLLSTSLSPGNNTYNALLTGSLAVTGKVYEVRASQTSATGINIDSVVFNSRLLFLPTYPSQAGPSGGSGISYITKSFTDADVIAGSVVIGNVPELGMVQNTAIIVDTGFDGSTTIEIGETSNELMTTAENTPSIASTYYVSNDRYYSTETEIVATFTGSATVGAGSIIIYFHTSV